MSRGKVSALPPHCSLLATPAREAFFVPLAGVGGKSCG